MMLSEEVDCKMLSDLNVLHVLEASGSKGSKKSCIFFYQKLWSGHRPPNSVCGALHPKVPLFYVAIIIGQSFSTPSRNVKISLNGILIWEYALCVLIVLSSVMYVQYAILINIILISTLSLILILKKVA